MEIDRFQRKDGTTEGKSHFCRMCARAHAHTRACNLKVDFGFRGSVVPFMTGFPLVEEPA